MEDLPDDAAPERLTRMQGRAQQFGNPHYTKFVRAMRLLLPLLALAIIAVVAAWPQMDQIRTTTVDEKQAQQTGGNELIHPRYESMDSQKQPYTLTADRAVQSARDPDVVLLDQPRGQMTLTSGAVVQAQAVKGAYRQRAHELMLEGDVQLQHSVGYTLRTQRAMFDMDNRKAWTDLPVKGNGPAGTIEGTGLQASAESGTLIFTGPAKLVLSHALKGL